jgi:antitoxin component YwqK of YwqJK toxin-antitoxin module
MSNKIFIPRKLEGEGSRWFDWNNRQPIIDGVQINQYDNDGREQGMWYNYRRNGSLISKGNYINGKEEGVWEWYYLSLFDGDDEFNLLHIRLTFKDGVLNGLRERFHITGEISSKTYFINGKEEGILGYIIRKIKELL